MCLSSPYDLDACDSECDDLTSAKMLSCDIFPECAQMHSLRPSNNIRLESRLSGSCDTVNECQKCLELKTELLNKKDVVDKETYDKIVRLSTSASGSQPSGNTRNDKIQQTPSSNSKNKNSKKHDNSDYVCINGDDCMSFDNLCVSNSMKDEKFSAKLRRKNLR
ncbi:hypothetical protein Tco_1337433 [Tanacetum coccineum]